MLDMPDIFCSYCSCYCLSSPGALVSAPCPLTGRRARALVLSLCLPGSVSVRFIDTGDTARLLEATLDLLPHSLASRWNEEPKFVALLP